MDVVVSLTLLGYCLAIRRFLRWPIEATPFFIVSCTIVLFYIFAYINILQPASLIFILLGGLCLITAPFYLPHQRSILFSDYFTPGLCLFIFYIIIFGILEHNQMLVSWDDITTWLPNAKFVYTYHGFLHAASPTTNYPPGSALFYYLFLRIGGFSEGRLLFAHLFLLFSPWIILLRQYNWSTINRAITLSLFIITISLLFKAAIGPSAELLMDSSTGLFFGGILVSYYIMLKDRGCWLYLAIAAMALVLLRPMVAPFVAILAMIIVCDQLYQIKNNQAKLLPALLFTGIWLLPILVAYSWLYFLKNTGVFNLWSFNKLYSAIAIPSSYKIHLIFFNNLTSFIMPVVFYLIALLLIYYIHHAATNQSNKKRILIANSLLSIGYFGYIASLLLVYFFLMPPQVANTLNAFPRFMCTYYLGWSLILLAQLLYLTDKPILAKIENLPNKLKYLIPLSFAILLSLYISIYYYINHVGFLQKNSRAYEREAIKQLVHPIQVVTKNSSIYVIWTGSYELMMTMINDELIPQKTYLSEGIFTSKAQFTKQISQFDYLLLAHVDQKFWQDYATFFQGTKRLPFTSITLCANTDFTAFNTKGCTIQTSPVYLYKVIKQQGEVHLINAKKIS